MPIIKSNSARVVLYSWLFLWLAGGNIMQLLGNTDKQKEAYKEALKEAKRARGGSFDIDSFNKEWCALNGIEYAPAVGRSSVAVPDSKEEKPETIERVAGQIVKEDDTTPDALREVVRDIFGAIDSYKADYDIDTFSKVKNGSTRFLACLNYVCRTVVKPSRILKRAPYASIGNTGGTTNKNAYDADKLLAFIDICSDACAREGLVFNRALYMALTGVSDDFLRGSLSYLTSSSIGLWEKVLSREYNASVNFAYNSDIGNMRNLNEREARPQAQTSDAGQAVGLSELRRLDG